MVLLVGISPSSVQAQDRQNVADVQLGEGKIMPVNVGMEGFHAEGILNMSVKHALAILVGVGAGMYLVENFVPTWGLPPELVGVLLGAMIGNWWYEHGMPPFGH
jgi:hypothetical protein